MLTPVYQLLIGDYTLNNNLPCSDSAVHYKPGRPLCSQGHAPQGPLTR